jgi:CRP-like cAMP-binding protein
MLRKLDIFPKEDVGLHSNLVQRFEFAMINKGEEIYHEGETAEEIFFIMEGQVGIIEAEVTIVQLKEGDYFGEMAIMTGRIGIRSVTINDSL